jgi:hypothetical protein
MINERTEIKDISQETATEIERLLGVNNLVFLTARDEFGQIYFFQVDSEDNSNNGWSVTPMGAKPDGSRLPDKCCYYIKNNATGTPDIIVETCKDLGSRGECP